MQIILYTIINSRLKHLDSGLPAAQEIPRNANRSKTATVIAVCFTLVIDWLQEPANLTDISYQIWRGYFSSQYRPSRISRPLILLFPGQISCNMILDRRRWNQRAYVMDILASELIHMTGQPSIPERRREWHIFFKHSNSETYLTSGVLDSIVVSILACHVRDPGSIPCRGVIHFIFATKASKEIWYSDVLTVTNMLVAQTN